MICMKNVTGRIITFHSGMKLARPFKKAKRGVQYGVSFNDGRSLYWFGRDELEFRPPDNNYEKTRRSDDVS